MLWSELAVDDVHPNDRGHEIIRNLVVDFLEKIYDGENLPAPLTQNRYEQAGMYPFTPMGILIGS